MYNPSKREVCKNTMQDSFIEHSPSRGRVSRCIHRHIHKHLDKYCSKHLSKHLNKHLNKHLSDSVN